MFNEAKIDPISAPGKNKIEHSCKQNITPNNYYVFKINVYYAINVHIRIMIDENKKDSQRAL